MQPAARSKTTTPKPDTKKAPEKRKRADWEAIERDYRTGRFSDQELADKHGNVVSRQAISKRAGKQGWTKDLTKAVRLATNAKLIATQATAKVAEQVAGQVAESCDATLTAVLAAAEVNKQVILGHREDIKSLRGVTMLAVAALTKEAEKLKSAEKPADPAGLLLSAQRATQSLSKLQAMERKAFGLDEEDDPAGNDVAPSALTDAQRASRLATLLFKAREAASSQTPEAGDGHAG